MDAGVALYGVTQQHTSLIFSDPLHIAAVGKPKARPGKKIEPLPMAAAPVATVAAAAASAVPLEGTEMAGECMPIANEDGRASPVARERILHDPWACTLVCGCVKRVNHTGICQIEASTPRGAGQIDYSALNSSGGRCAAKRKREAESGEPSGD